jgi:lipopolysaccharide/colanic/teichoic acid biosynthesis glycosyltransferase
MKRLFDIVASLIGLALVSPVLITIAVLIKREDHGPIFYRGMRIGRHGKPFRIFKFRTMVVNAEKIGGPSTADDDSRITRVGRRIRKRKLDELPQLINVLKGDMSFVGPRPEVKHYVDMFTADEKAILTVRPGITDWASLWNPDEGAILAGSPDPERTYMEKVRPEKIRLQLKYVRERSFLSDIRIIAQTVKAVVGRKAPTRIEDALSREEPGIASAQAEMISGLGPKPNGSLTKTNKDEQCDILKNSY